uniref:Uncharacterized protein n=1 Tax=viral metagenome TaxID=1070528 RepID=A0A6C0CR85_9ZZZZ
MFSSYIVSLIHTFNVDHRPLFNRVMVELRHRFIVCEICQQYIFVKWPPKPRDTLTCSHDNHGNHLTWNISPDVSR